MTDLLIRKPDNPAKLFLKRYRPLVARQESLQHAIDAAYSRAMSCTSRIKPVTVPGGNGAYDRMAEDVARISDATDQLMEAKSKADAALAEILQAIDAVPEETQKAVLTMRYVEGLDWIAISRKLQYAERQTFIIHGRALWAVNQWLKERGND